MKFPGLVASIDGDDRRLHSTRFALVTNAYTLILFLVVKVLLGAYHEVNIEQATYYKDSV